MYNVNMFNNERFDFKILSVLKLSFPVSERYSPKRRYHALIFRISGKARVVIGDDQIRLDKNDITFVPAGLDYTIQSETAETVIVIHFNASFANSPKLMNLHSTKPEIFITLFNSMLEASQSQPCGFVYRIDSVFLAILEQLERQSLESSANSLTYRILRAVDAMHSGFSDPSFSIDALASESGYCGSYFRRAFREEMGVSPKEFLCSLRIRHAAALLESGYYTVEEVAELCGFACPKYFSTAFKRAFGKNPSSLLPQKKQ